MADELKESDGIPPVDPERAPVEIWPAASFILDELSARQWDEARLAKASGLSPERVQQILAGAVWLSDGDSARIGHAFGVSPQFFLNLQSKFMDALGASMTGPEKAP